VRLLVGHPDDVDQQQLGEAVLAHDRDGGGPAVLGQHQVAVVLDVEQPVALHPGDGLAHRRATLMQTLGDAGTQRGHTFLFQLEDGAQVHLGGVHQVMFVNARVVSPHDRLNPPGAALMP
jgi:hypothetical protein